MKPSIGRVVHYVSPGTQAKPGSSRALTGECRAAIVTEVTEAEVDEMNPGVGGIYRDTVGLFVLDPSGQSFNRCVLFDDGAGNPGNPECLSRTNHGNPFRHCACGWTEAALKAGTWHWPERVQG